MEIVHCPFCGHVAYPDMTAERRIGVSVALCPAERIRFIYTEYRREIKVERLP